MYITDSSSATEQIRQRMGAETTTEEAQRMITLLSAAGITDTRDITDAQWFKMVAECVG